MGSTKKVTGAKQNLRGKARDEDLLRRLIVVLDLEQLP